MDQQGHGQPQVIGVVGGTAPMGYVTAPYQGSQMMVSNSGGTGSVVTQAGTIQSPGQPTAFAASPAQLAQQQLAYQQIHQQQQQQFQQQLQLFWANQYQEVEQTTDFKNHSLPLARIKKIMKADEDVRMISAEAPVIFAKACEMFILELTLRSWNHTEENKRRTLQKNDIAAAITRNNIFDFLVDIVPREEIKDEVLGSLPRTGGSAAPVGGPSEAIPYYYMPGQQVASPGMMMGRPAIDQSLYAQQPRPFMAQQVWQQQPQSQQTVQQQQSTSDS
ncbi:nuclear transcription factor Y subunit C-9-like [Aristolochia californica]|uniref:nuclear transcription factor Y subunit C-9-like n=1 Tax=Aristolochia californica TaxID=171875 RepID=UPI0035DBD091